MSNNEIMNLESRIELMQQYEAEASAFKAKAEEIKDAIKEQMTSLQMEEIVTPNYVVGFIDVLTSRFDTKLFKETCGEGLYNQLSLSVAGWPVFRLQWTWQITA